ncbi:MAG TPA: hypothetical protein ENH49_06980, partial [Candidatus Marinimicrobia bacterium]|nr:hypothetical protein [Candidatus Neomarinimicrobiota bacterium]
MKLKSLLTFFLFSLLMGEPSTYLNTNIHLYNIRRLSDFSIINLPFRILSINLDRQDGDFALNSTLAMEYRTRMDNSFFISSDPQDFTWD